MGSTKNHPNFTTDHQCQKLIRKTQENSEKMGDHQFLQTFKHSFSLADIDPDIDVINYLSGLYQNDQDSSSALSFQNSINFLPQNLENLHGPSANAVLTPTHPIISNERKRKANATSVTTTTSHSSSQLSEQSENPKTKRGGRGKKATKSNEKEDEKPREVIHVRAKRGQATDSHSLAERVRRGKINERLRCLKDIVPGCYKTMGMAVMLDEIINYVQSLKNQVDFLSMKLTAASSCYDFNTDTYAVEAMQSGDAFEAVKTESVVFPSAQLAQNLAYFPYSR